MKFIKDIIGEKREHWDHEPEQPAQTDGARTDQDMLAAILAARRLSPELAQQETPPADEQLEEPSSPQNTEPGPLQLLGADRVEPAQQDTSDVLNTFLASQNVERTEVERPAPEASVTEVKLPQTPVAEDGVPEDETSERQYRIFTRRNKTRLVNDEPSQDYAQVPTEARRGSYAEPPAARQDLSAAFPDPSIEEAVAPNTIADANACPEQDEILMDFGSDMLADQKLTESRVKTRLLGFDVEELEDDPFATEAMPQGSGMSQFPVGWLVVVEGPGRGAGFTLSSGVSLIGRGEDQTIRLDFGDTSISRSHHAAVAYDPEQKEFFIGHGGKANLVRRNGRPVLVTEPLSSGDLIRIGETSLRFVPLCGVDFSWERGAGEYTDFV